MENRKKHIFYSVVGMHGKEQVDQIINRKNFEVRNAGYSLWSAKIDKKSKELVWNLPENEEVWVMCKVNTKAFDPVKNEMSVANEMIGPMGVIQINESVSTTYSTGKNYQAYVVEEYIDIRNNPMNFNLANYVSTKATNEEVLFFSRFNSFSRFQNVYGYQNDLLNLKYFKKIGFIMKLRYPFVVDIK